MTALFEHALAEMEDLFEVLAGCVPPPAGVERGPSIAYRYAEQSAQQAIVQRLARSISSLRAAVMLVDLGYLQETATLQRAVDDFAEDIQFLSLGLMLDDDSALQQKYLDHFYAEVIPDPSNPWSALDKRPSRVQRREIRQEIARCERKLIGEHAPSAANSARAVSSLYSSYVHGGSPSTMEMYGGLSPHFTLRGIPDSPLKDSHVADLVNQFYRTALAFGWAAKVLGAQGIDGRLQALQDLLAGPALGNSPDGGHS